MSSFKRLISEIHRRSIWQVLAIYVGASWVVFEIVQTVTEGLGLPPWFPPFAALLLLIGLPIVLGTAFVQEGVSPARWHDTTLMPTPEGGSAGGPREAEGVRRLFTWRNALLGGLTALALWGVLATGWILFADEPPPTASDPNAARPSLAVLPFDNLSPDPDNAYFAAGMHEEMLTQLGKVGGIDVISRTSVLKYQGTKKNLSEIAEELGVTTILEGSVRRDGEEVRITVQLIDAREDRHIWADNYDRQLSDVFRIQTEVANRVVEELKGALTPAEQTELARKPTDDMEAYAHYLRGHEHSRNLWAQEESEAAAEAYQRAVDLDPSFAAAWARLVQTRLWLAWNYSAYAERARARAALDRLKALAPESPELRLARGLWLYYGVQQYEEALQAFELLGEMWPGHADVMRYRGALYRRLGRFNEAIKTWQRLLELDPADAGFALTISQTYLMMRRFDEAERYAKIGLSLDPTVQTHWRFFLIQRLWRGDTAAVRTGLDSAGPGLNPGFVASWRAQIVLVSDREEEALEILRDVENEGSVAAELWIRTAAAAGEPDVLSAWADTLRAMAETRLAKIPDDYPAVRSTWLSRLALAHAYLGNGDDAVRLADEAVDMFPVSRDALYGPRLVRTQAEVYTVLGHYDGAVDQLSYLLSIPAEGVTVPLLRIDPRWAPLRDNPRFQALLAKYE